MAEKAIELQETHENHVNHRNVKPETIEKAEEHTSIGLPHSQGEELLSTKKTFLKSKFQELSAAFLTLKAAPRELWLVYVLKTLESYAYFSQSYILVIYLSEEFGYGDAEAAWIYGLTGFITSAIGVCIGFVIDNLGVRLSLVLGSACTLISRFVIAVSHSRWLVVGMLLTLLPFGSALGIPVMSTGIRRYTNSSNRAFGFSLFYVVMNVAALVAGFAVDLFRYSVGIPDAQAGAAGPGGTGAEPVKQNLGAYRILLLTGAFANLIGLLVGYFSVREISVDETGEASQFEVRRGTPWAIAKEILWSGRFWRFILFILLLIGVRFVFRHLDITLPKYLLREVSPNAPYGTIIAINPFLIIILVPIVSALYHTRVTAFESILVGSLVSSLSVFWMIIGPYYWNTILFVIFLSFGEAMWSPRLYEYTTTIAPEGREGTYAALSTAPMFAATLAVGGVSGWLLEGMCPNEGTRHCNLMWLVIALMTISSPVLMYLLRNVIQKDLSHKYPTSEGEATNGGPLRVSPSKDRLLYAQLKDTEDEWDQDQDDNDDGAIPPARR
mmetsp:Transcript_13777/g.23019  ORF Transcript_13777/g.23019 Transcript_13777/m.23019 type:complete len:555 (-) Transcript_13777:363-2027(-)|eukprot:CAMPEP_0184368524 /NCGR_PEP_ID=MMETSP1089-20130417/161714_1 /TAXON_ID=38269 ORGANISM="Gloeochaete wittrockiana, Strain SAG46.84" /NCGR_SAMPLE_ID=MMETSP1089 /ASSEMBLY_ACC=CAM_ASM_000445 /LENGTH=554 /DNA_ID=CAMNT_0026710825 /DNA_START=94 /DNA_END=1758 /DNA_ORIENTATION=+